jgi:hypothetical protein
VGATVIAAPPVTHDVIPVLVQPAHATSGADFAWAAPRSRTGIPHLAVFSRRATAADRLPSEVRVFFRTVHGSTPRLLVASGAARVYAFRNARHQVCVVRTPLGEGQCVADLAHGAFPDVESRKAVFGIVDDGAVRVDVTVRGRTRRAVLGRNGFLLALRGAAAPTRIIVHERNGERHVFTIERCTTPTGCR